MINPKAKETNITYENCPVCMKSYKKGRGLNIHLSKTSCRSVLERSRKLKSKGSPQETNHSGSTNNVFPNCSNSALEREMLKDDKNSNAKESPVKVTPKEALKIDIGKDREVKSLSNETPTKPNDIRKCLIKKQSK